MAGDNRWINLYSETLYYLPTKIVDLSVNSIVDYNLSTQTDGFSVNNDLGLPNIGIAENLEQGILIVISLRPFKLGINSPLVVTRPN